MAESRKESRPAERVKQLVLLLGGHLLTDVAMMANLATRLSDLGVNYLPTDSENTVLWKRRVTERCVDNDAKVLYCNEI